MLSSVKVFFVLSFLIPLHVQATHQYNYKNIPLTFSDTYDQNNGSNVVCTSDYFPNALNRNNSSLRNFDLSQINDLFEAFSSAEGKNVLSNEHDADTYPRNHDSENKANYYASNSINLNPTVLRYSEVIFGSCYSDAVFSNWFNSPQMENPVSPVPELPGAVLLLSGLGFMALVHRMKHMHHAGHLS